MKTALLLSAGGMFGAYQAGAWKALSDRFRPDMVIGASVGSLNGWGIAGGADSAELAAFWTDPRLGRLMRASRRPSAGLFNPEPLAELVREMMDRWRPRIPFALVVVDVPRLRPRLIHGPEVTWRHLMASCAIPVGFPPVRIDGRLAVDGGLLGVLPLWAAARMGATHVVAVNALPLMPSRTVRAAVGLIRRLAPPPPSEEPAVICRIEPRTPLGRWRDALFWKEENIRRWIDLGENHARSACPGVFD